MGLAEYRQLVRSLASKRDGQPIYNASVEHSSIVIKNLFANAERRVDVLSGRCNARVYGRASLVEEARLFLAMSARNRLRIILEEDSPEDRAIHPLFQAFADFASVELRIASRAVQDLYEFHFVLMDDDSYRFASDKTKAAAVAAFGHRKGAKNLDGIYEYLWDQCEPVSIIPTQA